MDYTRDFLNWLVNMGYVDVTDVAEDVNDITRDLKTIRVVAPKFFNLIMCMCNSERRAHDIDNIDKTDMIVSLIMRMLPDHAEDGKFWGDGDEILCETETEANVIADLFDQLYGEGTVNTGYYDPEEDETKDLVDKYTGWHYVNFI